MKNLVLIFLNFFTFWMATVHTKPVPNCVMPPGGWIHQKEECVPRARRSIPDVDAVNPDYMSGEVPSGQEDPQQAISQLTLVDHVSNLFRSGKDDKGSQRQHARQGQEDRRENLARQEKLTSRLLRSDEQEECYKQQNIDVPGAEESVGRRWVNEQNFGGMPIVDGSQGLRPSLGRDEAARARIGRFNNKRDKEEITSLYSDPEKIVRIKNAKHLYRPKVDDAAMAPKRVYKPAGILPQFPVYDEDIDFQPDPLQGILDDKYWQDQQDQEGVIRKYMDLAINNMMPSGSEVEKRSAERTDFQVKSVSSNAGFRDAASERERECPCKELVACGECSKGKNGKKSNCTVAEERVPFGRKLLSLHCDETNNLEEETFDGVPSLGKFVSLDYEDDSSDDKEVHIDEGSPPNYMAHHIGRKLLSFSRVGVDHGEDMEENYEDVVDVPGYKKIRFDNENQNQNNVFNKKRVYDDYSNDVWGLQPYYDRVQGQPMINRQLNKGDEENHRFGGYSKNELTEESAALHNPVDNLPNKPAEFYTPNKGANRLQQLLMPKPKIRNKELNTSEEFEKGQIEAYKNASLAQATYKPVIMSTTLSTSNGILANNLDMLNPPKGRRSYPESFSMKDHRFSRLVQTPDDAMAKNGLNSLNQSASSSPPPVGNSTLPVSVKSNTTSTLWNATTETIETPFIATNATFTTTIKKKVKSDEEDPIDAEVANDIVETVMAESLRGSVLGNSLGLCRRNDSLNVRYGRVIPETEKVLRTVTDCLMKRLKAHLAKQSCIILDSELLEFLQWLVLKGESNKDYVQRSSGKYHPKPAPVPNITTCAPVAMPTEATTCDPALEAPPPPDHSGSNSSILT